MSREPNFARANSGSGVNLHLVGAFSVPVRNDAKGNWPIGRVLPDRSVPVVHQLVAVVFELLSKVVQHRQSLVAGGTSQAVLSGKGRKGVSAAGKREDTNS